VRILVTGGAGFIGSCLVRALVDLGGNDRRYALNAGRIRTELGWQPRIPFAEGLAATVDWYRVERGWWERVKTGEYRRFYARLYGDRLKTDRASAPKRGER
jgi:dTDP-glucose 4,6-dehydratase